MSTGRVQNINVGVTGIERRRREEDVHLPTKSTNRLSFLPEPRPLDEILGPPTLDDRLNRVIIPSDIGQDLLQPGAMQDARKSLESKFYAVTAKGEHRPGSNLAQATALLQHQMQLDDEIREALAALLRA